MSGINEHINFIGSRVPTEVVQLAKCLRKFDVDSFDRLVKAAVGMVDASSTDASRFESLTEEIPKEDITNCYPGVHTIIRRAMRQPQHLMKKSSFKKDLAEIRIPELFHASLIEAVFGDACHTVDDVTNDDITKLRWRVDVGISSTSVNRLMSATLLLNVADHKGEHHTIEVSKEKFHELRLGVAEVLNYMQQLEKRSIFKVDS